MLTQKILVAGESSQLAAFVNMALFPDSAQFVVIRVEIKETIFEIIWTPKSRFANTLISEEEVAEKKGGKRRRPMSRSQEAIMRRQEINKQKLEKKHKANRDGKALLCGIK